MCISLLLLSLLLPARQAEAPPQARELVEKLKSENIEERGQAYQQLKLVGEPAREDLQRVAKGDDAEAARLAERLLKVIPIFQKLTPALRKEFPQLEERVVDKPEAWTDALLEAADDPEKHPELRHRDLEILAVQGARTTEHPAIICQVALHCRLRLAIPEITRYLSGAEPGLRASVALTLGDMNAKEAMPAIVALLKDEAPQVRGAAAAALQALGARDAAGSILPLLQDPSEDVRRSAAWALASLGAKEAVPALLQILDGDSEQDQEFALSALSTSNLRERRDALVAALAKHTDGRRERIAWALVRTKETEDLIRLLEDRDPAVRQAAALGLGSQGRKESISELRKLLGTETGGQAARHLYRMGDKGAVSTITRRLALEDADDRRSALQDLWDLLPREAIPGVIPLLRNEDPNIRQQAAGLLASLKATEALVPLRTLLDDADPDVRGSALEALAGLEDRDIVPRALKLLRAGGKEAKAAARAVGSLGVREAIPQLAILLGSEHPSVRESACKALGELRASGQIGDLVERFKDKDDDVMWSAIGALEHMGPQECLLPMLSLLEKGDARGRRIAVEILAEIGSRDTVPALVQRLRDPSMPVRLEAAMALCCLGSREGVPLLLEERANLIYLNALRDASSWKRVRAARSTVGRGRTSPGDLKDDVTRWASDRGLALRWESGSEGDLYLWKFTYGLGSTSWLHSPDSSGPLSYWMGDGRFAAIVEPDVIRVVPYDEAWIFWKNWAAQLPEKGK